MKRRAMMIVVVAVAAFPLAALANPDVEISPMAHDFGDVAVGSSATTVVTLTNLDTINSVFVYSVVWQVSNPAFSFTTTPASLPYTLPPGQTFYVEVTFSPTAIGFTSTNLVIQNSDPFIPTAFIPMGGVGIDVEPPISVTVEDILAFFDASVANGTLVGSGPGNSANGRVKALRNMLEASGDLIEGNYFAQACQQLQDAYGRTDGLPRPPDFVAGAATEQLAAMIAELMGQLGCE